MNENKTYKEYKNKLDISPAMQKGDSTNAVVYSFDLDTFKFTYELKMNGQPLSLANASEVNIVLYFGGDNPGKYPKANLVGEIEDKLKSIVSFVMPKQYLGFDGQVLGEIDITFKNGQSLTAGYFSFVMKPSYVNGNIEVEQQVYVEQFEDLKNLIGKQSEDINKILIDMQEDIKESNAKVDEIKDLIVKNDVYKKTDGEKLEKELIDGRYSKMLDKHFPSLQARGDFWDNSISNIHVDVTWFGAVGDNKTINDEAINKAIEFLKSRGGGTLYFPRGIYLINFVIKITDIDIKIEGEGTLNSIVKVKDQSDLLHKERDNTSNKNTNLDNLFRDYHAAFLFINCDINIENIYLDGNSENNFIMTNDKKFNYYAATIHSHLGITDYRYYHGIDVLWTDGKKHKFNMKNCKVHQFPWNNVCINNQGVDTYVDLNMQDNFIESSAQDGVSIHKVHGNIRVNNKVKNSNSHATHIYHTVQDAFVDNEEYIYTEDDYFNFEPNIKNDLRKNALQIGHGSYVENLLKNIRVNNCKVTKADNVTYKICGAYVGKTIENLSFLDCDFSSCDYPMIISPIVLGEFTIDNCKLNYFKDAGILFDLAGLSQSGLHPNYEEPYEMTLNISRSSIVSKKSDTNAIRLTLPGGKADELIDSIKINLLDNKMSASTITQSPKVEVIDNNSISPNLLNFSYEVVDGVAQGWRGRNSTNDFTKYVKQSAFLQDISGQYSPKDYLNVTSTGNPSVAFDVATYYEKVILSQGTYAFRFLNKSDSDVKIRLELRMANGTLLKTLIPDTKINMIGYFKQQIFYFNVDSTLVTNNQIFQWIITADNSTNKITNFCLADVKLEKTDAELPALTKNIITSNNEVFYSTDTVPLRAGLITVGGGHAFVSTGNKSPSDWKKIT